MVCLCCAITMYSLYGELRTLLREVKDRDLQKASDTHIFLPIFTTALVF
jgi:hypothetical protein